MSDGWIAISPRVHLDPDALEVRFIRASGPGGQHVNKSSTAVELRYDTTRARHLPEDVRARLLDAAGSRATADGTVVIRAERHRSQAMNRDDALSRLLDLMRGAAVPPRARLATRPTVASQRRRLDKKIARGAVKRARGPVGDD
jgi:ribosome-associated protein